MMPFRALVAAPLRAALRRFVSGTSKPQLVLSSTEGSVGTLTLNNNERRNALSDALVEQLIDGLKKFEIDEARVVIIRAHPGVKVWCAGHDVNELPVGGKDPLAHGDTLRRLIRTIEDHPSPVIALLEGSVWGGGCELAMSCDLAIATPDVTFAITPAKLSIPYNISGLLTFLNRVPYAMLKEMIFTGDVYTAKCAFDHGVINHVRDAAVITEYTNKLAQTISRNAPLSLTAMKRSLGILASAHALPPILFEQIQNERRKAWDSEDYKEALAAFKEKRKPTFAGK